MSRTLSLDALAGAQAEETGEVYLILLTFDSDDLASPLRFTNDSVPTTSRGDVYDAVPFSATLPSDEPGEIREMEISVDNIDRRMVNALRTASDEMTATMELIIASAPDDVIASFVFDVSAASYNATQASVRLSYESILNEPFPAERFTPTSFPGLY